jgi:sugar phosphate isomerase/epimerase
MIYTSTSCLKKPKDLIKVLNEYQNAGLENVELGSVHQYFPLNELKKYNFNFLIHNYFPPPKIPFNFNLASQKKSIKNKSISMAKKAIELCRKLDSPLYTFHAGFTVDPPKLGMPFPKQNSYDRTKSISTFIESILEIKDTSKKYGIKIAMEPNVVQKFNLVNGRNELLLFSEFTEIKKLSKLFGNNFGLLLDLGHTSVTSHWLNFDKDVFVKECKKYIFAVHISHNNGKQDQHRSLTKDCWQVSKLKNFKKIPIILETMNLNTIQIKKNIKIIKNSFE